MEDSVKALHSVRTSALVSEGLMLYYQDAGSLMDAPRHQHDK